jgi:branched-subunit amino acid transport protein
MSAGKILVFIGEVLLGIVISTIAMPVLWFLARVVGLLQPMRLSLGMIRALIYVGGPILGALVGAGVIAAILRALDEESRLGIVLAGIGGAIGGLAGSVMFFPIVAIL